MLEKYDSADSSKSQRDIANELGIPRSTLQHWLNRKDGIDADPEIVSFFESSVGTAFLHRLAIGAHFAMTMSGTGSIRNVCQFFELTGLDKFIASSYGAQYNVSKNMEQAIVDFDHEERSRLAISMQPKEITVCQDETFHPEICLVAIEPISNFILLEKYTKTRQSSEWTTEMEKSINDLPVTIVQSASDEAKGITHHVKKGLGAHHAPDIFHVQQEVTKGTSAVLSSKKKKAEAAAEKASEEVKNCIEAKENYASSKPCPGRPPQFDKRIETAAKKQEEAIIALEEAESHQKLMKEEIQKIGKVYHPVDIETGKLQETEEVSKSLEDCFCKIEEIANEANLQERCMKRIKKAKKVLLDMIATILFFHMTVNAKIEALSLPAHVEKAVREILIPGLYLRRISNQAKESVERTRLKLKSLEILESLEGSNNPFNELDTEEVKMIEQVGEECANLFQRSSSCVEGRNGQLSLRHHGLHRLSSKKLEALTSVHNYFIKRRDGTTAAERFFGSKPKEMFEYLLNKIDMPGRPAKDRC